VITPYKPPKVVQFGVNEYVLTLRTP